MEPGGGVPGTPTVADLADNLYGSDWASRSKIWYPLDETLFTDPQDITSNLKKVLHLGICVDECPMPNGKLLSPNKVKWYRCVVVESSKAAGVPRNMRAPFLRRR